MTTDNIMYMASEVGVVNVEPEKIIQKVNDVSFKDADLELGGGQSEECHLQPKHLSNVCISQGRLKPGRMLLVDTKEKVFKKDEILKSEIAGLRPVASWLNEVKQRHPTNQRTS